MRPVDPLEVILEIVYWHLVITKDPRAVPPKS